MAIKAGQSDYETLVQMADDLTPEISEAFKQSELRDEPDKESILNELVSIRNALYSSAHNGDSRNF